MTRNNVRSLSTDVTFSGTVQIKLFVNEVRLPNMDQVLCKFPGVSGCSYSDREHILNVNFSGSFAQLPKLEQSVSDMGVTAQMVAPFHVVLIASGLNSKAEWQSKLQGTGAQCVYELAGQWHVFTDLDRVSFDTFDAAAKSVGAKCQVISHEWLTLEAEKDPSSFKKDILDTKYVMRVDTMGNSIKVLVMKGRVSRGTLESMLVKRGCSIKREK